VRYPQTLLEIGAEQNSTIVFPLPIDLLRLFLEHGDAVARQNGHNLIGPLQMADVEPATPEAAG
jgi:hypothetical protein